MLAYQQNSWVQEGIEVFEGDELEEHYKDSFDINPLLGEEEQANAYLAKAVTPIEHAQFVLYVLKMYTNFSKECDPNQWQDLPSQATWLMPWIHKNMSKSVDEMCGCGTLFSDVIDLTDMADAEAPEEAEAAPEAAAVAAPVAENAAEAGWGGEAEAAGAGSKRPRQE